MKAIDMFCGRKSFAKNAEKAGFDVFSVDIDGSFSPSLTKNILEMTIDDIPEEFRNCDILWASPPCTCYSVASIGRNWTGGKGAYIPKRKETVEALQILRKLISLIDEIKPKVWFIENPVGVMRKMPEMQNFQRHTVTYCQYGDTRMKPTDIWTNSTTWQPRPRCKNGSPCHESAPRGSKTGTQGLKTAKDRSVVPDELCMEILRSI
jgi:site-specific DNA-cytosine methylase